MKIFSITWVRLFRVQFKFAFRIRDTFLRDTLDRTTNFYCENRKRAPRLTNLALRRTHSWSIQENLPMFSDAVGPQWFSTHEFEKTFETESLGNQSKNGIRNTFFIELYNTLFIHFEIHFFRKKLFIHFEIHFFEIHSLYTFL